MNLEEANQIAEDVDRTLNILNRKLRALNPAGNYGTVRSREFSSLIEVRKHLEMRRAEINSARAEIERLESDDPESAQIQSLLREIYPSKPIGVMDIMAASERRREQHAQIAQAIAAPCKIESIKELADHLDLLYIDLRKSQGVASVPLGQRGAMTERQLLSYCQTKYKECMEVSERIRDFRNKNQIIQNIFNSAEALRKELLS